MMRRQSTLKFINQTGLIRFCLQISNSLFGFLEDRIPEGYFSFRVWYKKYYNPGPRLIFFSAIIGVGLLLDLKCVEGWTGQLIGVLLQIANCKSCSKLIEYVTYYYSLF